MKKLNKNARNLFILAIVEGAVSLCLIPFAFFGHLDVLLGWIMGSIIALVCFFTLVKFTGGLITLGSAEAKPSRVFLSSMCFFLRIVLYAGGLVVGALCTFKSKEWFGGFDYFNFWAIFASYMPTPIVVSVMMLIDNAKAKKSAGGEEGSK